MSKHLTLSDTSALADQLLSGAIGVLPTDTVYGVVCRAADETAVARLYALKQREGKPGTVIAASMQQLIDLGFKGRYIKAYEAFWPNPLSIVVPSSQDYLHLGLRSVAVRVIKGPSELLDLLAKTGPLLTTSANHPGKSPAGTIEQAQTYFENKVDFYADGGDLTDQKPSTLIHVVDDAIEVLRPGAITISESGRIS